MRLSSGLPAPASGATPNRRLLKLAVPVGVGLVLWWMFAVVLAQEPAATVENYGFRLSCDTSVSEGSTLACTLTNTTDTAAEWPVVGIIHLSNDADRALVVGEPVDVAFGSLTSSPDIEDGVWWIGDVLVGYSRFDWSGQAAASSDSETTDTRTVNITAVDDTAWEESESFYITLGPNATRGVGFLYDNRQQVTIDQSDSKRTDATLDSLTITAGTSTTNLSAPVATSRSMSLGYTTTEMSITPTATYKPSSISVAVTAGGVASSFTTGDGQESKAIPLGVGTNMIAVTVTAENGTSTETYTITATRAALAGDADVTVSTDDFTLTCPGSVTEGETLDCTLTNSSSSSKPWPVVAFLHSSADDHRALIAEDPIVPETSSQYSRDVRIKDPQAPSAEAYNFGYGELFSGGSQSVYTTYGYEKFDWDSNASAGAKRTVSVEVLIDSYIEGDETFYVAVADSGYTGLSQLIENKAPIMVEDLRESVLRAMARDSELLLIWSPWPVAPDESVTSYDLQHIDRDSTDNWTVVDPIWSTGGGDLMYGLQNLTNGVSLDLQIRGVVTAGGIENEGEWSSTVSAAPMVLNHDPTFDGGDTATRSIAENTPAGQPVGAPVSASDIDSPDLVYAVTSGADIFDLDASSGQLRTKAPLNREAVDTYTVELSVTDGRDSNDEVDPTADDEVTVTVTVDDVDEPPTVAGRASPSTSATPGHVHRHRPRRRL